ncbi:MAG: hypothetical protein OEV71_15145 [Nitrospira sp.]|nr:hypothetical protein [Nitrospira sp.]
MAALNTPPSIRRTELAGETIETVLTQAPGNDAPIGEVKVMTNSGWFAARSSGTEDIYKIYAESFRGPNHLRRILEEAQIIVDKVLATAQQDPRTSSVPTEKERP